MKYENEGGPGAPDVVELLLRESNDPGTDVGGFFDVLVLNWAIAGSDAHAKNYSLMLLPGAVRLAPFYDLLSVLPYELEIPYRRAKLAMRVDREYLIWKLRRRHWEGLAIRCGLDPGPVVERTIEVLEAVPGAARDAAGRLKGEGLSEEIIDRLEERITSRSDECLGLLTAT